MADNARQWTDEQLAEIEARLKKTYQKAQAELSEKWAAYMATSQARLATLYNAYLNAPADKKAEALLKYQNAAQSITLRNQWYNDMVERTAYEIAHVNQRAIEYLNGQMADIYMVNYNQPVPGTDAVGVRFDLADAATVKRLIESGDIQLPHKELNIPKDMAWNTRAMNDAVLQGILQGESMTDIAKRLFPEMIKSWDFTGKTQAEIDDIMRKNWQAAVRNARTMVTQAENRGRLDRYESLEDEGLIMCKIWIATPDNRTRHAHFVMDGQERQIDELFEDGWGYELEYPGDPSAPAKTVYNCRCSMRSEILGVRGKSGKIEYIPREAHNGLHQQQMREEEARRNGGSS